MNDLKNLDLPKNKPINPNSSSNPDDSNNLPHLESSSSSQIYHIAAFPKSTYVGRIVAKEHFYDKTNSATKMLFRNEIARITWEYKLAPETINLAPKTWPELEVFRIELKNHTVPMNALKIIDSCIAYPILFIITKDGVEKAIISYKEQAAKNANITKVDTYFETDWNDHRLSEVKIQGLDVDTVYHNFIRQIAGDRLTDNNFNINSNLDSNSSSDMRDIDNTGIAATANTTSKAPVESDINNHELISESITEINVSNDNGLMSKVPINSASPNDKFQPTSIKTELEQMKSREKLQKQIATLDRRIKSEPSIGKKQKLARERHNLLQLLK